MDEIRINNTVKMQTRTGADIKGKVCALQYDRVAIIIDIHYRDVAKQLQELDNLKITADTHFGAKTMISSVISTMNDKNIIVVENSKAIEVEQKRKYVRVVCNFDIKINFNNNEYRTKTKNISAGGIAFEKNNIDYKLNDDIKINFPKEIFDKEFECSAKIIKINDDTIVAEFNNINEYNESKIMKYVFKNVSKSSTGC